LFLKIHFLIDLWLFSTLFQVSTFTFRCGKQNECLPFGKAWPAPSWLMENSMGPITQKAEEFDPVRRLLSSEKD
jgi:hypothetical protein